MKTSMAPEALLPGPIVVGLDGSTGSRGALELAITLARAAHAEVIAVHVAHLVHYAPALYGLEPTPPTPAEWRPDLEAKFQSEWCEPLHTSGLRYQMVFAEGRPAPTLIEVARKHRASMLAVGSRGAGGFNELLLGSVSHQLVTHAAVPVLVVPTADDPPPASAAS